MAFNPTPEQKDAICARHNKPDRTDSGSITVSAAAGSGKTAVITQRVIRLITEDGIDADRLLVVTFTNAAAGEMRTRISQALDKKIAENPTSARLVRQKMLLSKANICTVDSFCKRLVTEHFEESNVPPDVNIMSALLEKSISQRAMDDAFENCYEQYGNRFYDVTGTIGSAFATRKAVTDIYDFLRTLAFPDEWISHAKGLYYNFENIKDSIYGRVIFNDVCERAQIRLQTLESAATEILGCEKVAASRKHILDYCIQHAVNMIECAQSGDWDGILSLVNSFELPGTNTLKPKSNTQIRKQVDAANKAYGSFVKKLKDTFFCTEDTCRKTAIMLRENIDMLFECTARYSQRLEELKKASGVMDFADIEYAALRLLVDRRDGTSLPTQTALNICEGIDEVLVDEYQDTNDLQNAIFLSLSQNGKKLFVVGDVKQSIYGFRKADPSIFTSRFDAASGINDPKKADTRVVLSQNFRSRPGICDGINYIFSLLLCGGDTGIKYDHNHILKAGRTFPQKENADTPDCCFSVITQDTASSPAEAQAKYIALKIVDMLEKECVTDEQSGLIRKARYGDFAVILRSPKKTAHIYTSVLEEYGIPVSCESSADFFASPDIKKLIAALRLINDPFDDVSFLSVMLSPMFGFTPDDAADLRIKHRDMPLYAAAALAAKEDHRLKSFTEKIESLRSQAVFSTPQELIDRLLNETAYTAFAAATADRGSNEMIDAFRSLAAEYPSSGYKGLSGFLRYLEAAENEQADIKVASRNNDDNSVRIMSTHHSKGLQFPVCFCADLSTPYNKTDISSPMVLGKESGIGLMFTTPDNRRTTTVMRQASSICKKKELVAEELRIFYVAATRAIDKLYLISCVKALDKEVSDAQELISATQTLGSSLSEASILNADSIGRLLYACMLIHPDMPRLRSYATAAYNCEITSSRFECDIASFDALSSPEDLPVSVPDTPLSEETGFDLHEAAIKAADIIKKRLEYTYPYEQLNSIAAKHSVTGLLNPDVDTDELKIPSFAQKEGCLSRDVGNAIHAFLRFMPLGITPDEIDDCIAKMCSAGLIDTTFAQLIPAEKIAKFLESDIYSRMKKSSFVKREWRFLFEVPASRIDPELEGIACDDMTVIQGTIDCAFLEDDQFVVVDYKTGRADKEKLLHQYSQQLNIYAEALKTIYGIEVKEKIIYSFGTNEYFVVE